MIATHSVKLTNARLKQAPVRSRITGNLPEGLISSQSVSMSREFWAAPLNAADMKRYREEAAAIGGDYEFETSLPQITDPQLKQMLLPTPDWREDHYISTTPVYSMGLLAEWNDRQFTQEIPSNRWVVQPTPAAMANHGEMLLMRSGKLQLMRRGVSRIEPGSWTGDFVQLTARCERMNISSGMMSVGFPSMTAIGGMVHVVERATGLDLDFAIGIRDMQRYQSLPRLTLLKTSIGSTTGRAKGRKMDPVPGYSAEEVTGNAEIVLLLRTSGNPEEVAQALKKIHRVAGGQLFDIDISIKHDARPPVASYLIDASRDVIRLLATGEAHDSLDAALRMHTKDGGWKNGKPWGKWFQFRNGYTLSMTGYAFLENPVKRPMSRNNGGLHAWSESVFSLITQGSMSDMAWWSRESADSWVCWRGCQR